MPMTLPHAAQPDMEGSQSAGQDANSGHGDGEIREAAHPASQFLPIAGTLEQFLVFLRDPLLRSSLVTVISFRLVAPFAMSVNVLPQFIRFRVYFPPRFLA